MLCLGLFSCYDENGTYGSDLVDSAFRNVRIDTSTVVVTSVLIDSLETSGKNVALVGRYKHSLWGVVSSHSFIAYGVSEVKTATNGGKNRCYNTLIFS